MKRRKADRFYKLASYIFNNKEKIAGFHAKGVNLQDIYDVAFEMQMPTIQQSTLNNRKIIYQAIWNTISEK